jgi:hypothetical protein
MTIWADLNRLFELTDHDEAKILLLRRLGEFLEDVHRIAVSMERLEQIMRARR